MNVAEVVEWVKRDFGDEYDVIITDDDVYRWIYAGEMEIIRETGINISTQNTQSNAFPANIPSFVQVIRLSRDGRPLMPTSIEELDNLSFNVQAKGTPQYWYFNERDITLYPEESGTPTTISIDYIKTPVLITGPPPSPTSLTVPEVYHPDLVNFVMARAHEKRGNLPKSVHFQEKFEKDIGNRAEEADQADAPIYKQADPFDLDTYYLDW